jgi:hypothetical protein
MKERLPPTGCVRGPSLAYEKKRKNLPRYPVFAASARGCLSSGRHPSFVVPRPPSAIRHPSFVVVWGRCWVDAAVLELVSVTWWGYKAVGCIPELVVLRLTFDVHRLSNLVHLSSAPMFPCASSRSQRQGLPMVGWGSQW